MFIYDIANVLAIFIVIFITFRIGLIPLWLAFFLGLFALTPFVLNGIFFPVSYMPDQLTYFYRVQGIRSLDVDWGNTKMLVSNMMLAFIPLPYVETFQSLGFFNRLLATIITIWLYASKNLRGWPLLFLLFYPSFILYSSLGLRDTLVFLFMIMSVILFLENRRILALLFSVPLFFIKFQNFFLIIVFFIVHLYFARGTLFYKYRYIFLTLVVAILAPYVMTIIELVDFYRWALFYDDGGLYSDYVSVKTLEEFAYLTIQSAPYFLMKPFPWEADNFFQLLQSIENFFLLGFLVFMFLKVSRVDKRIAFKWLAYIVIAFGIYGLVVFNFGTAVRYKFPFVLIMIIGMAYELYLNHGKLILNRRTKH